MRELFFKKRGQMTIFIIVAIIIVALVSLFFILRDDTSLRGVPDDLQPVYNDFQNCIESNVMEGVSILESQGGYIYLPGYRNSVDPFSSWFYFSGTSIPYWQYEQGGITFEQVPTKKEMENQLERYLESNIQDCSFQEYEEQGFSINKGENISSNIEIKESRLEVSLNMDLTVEKEDNSYSLEKHSTRVKSYLGSLYDSAVKIYEKEKTTLFLEEYGIDVLRLYAPVDGLEIQCSPLIWDADNVFSELEDALETNTFALSSGERFQNQDDYFKQDLDIDNNARFLNSQDWEHSFEVLPSEGDKLISEPVGNNKALGALGFCYNTYHFVYDLKYPVLVQVYNENSFNEGGETFQFPLGVVIKGNKPREPLKGEAKEQQPIDICGDKNVNMTISTYDRQAQGVNSKISIECLNTKCYLGETGEEGVLRTSVPQCVNGQIVASSENFKTSETTYSTVQGGSATIFMDPIYELDLGLLIGNKKINEYNKEEVSRAVIYFDSQDYSTTVTYPQEQKVKLTEGQYSIEANIYGNSSLSLDQETGTEEYCLDVSDSIAGDFIPGQKCFEVDSPDMINSNVLIGGGSKDYYFSDSSLRNSEKILLNVDKFSKPGSLAELQENYGIIENKEIDLEIS